MWMRTGMHCMASRRPNLNGFPSRFRPVWRLISQLSTSSTAQRIALLPYRVLENLRIDGDSSFGVRKGGCTAHAAQQRVLCSIY